jgi:hypothetical protein
MEIHNLFTELLEHRLFYCFSYFDYFKKIVFLQAAALFYMILVIVVVGINIGSSNIRQNI